MQVARKDVQLASGTLQICVGLHVYDLYQQNEVEAIFLVDAENAFSSISIESNVT